MWQLVVNEILELNVNNIHRLLCTGPGVEASIDVHATRCPLKENSTFQLTLEQGVAPLHGKTYSMSGKTFEHPEVHNGFHASFGGLLLQLKGAVVDIPADKNCYVILDEKS